MGNQAYRERMDPDGAWRIVGPGYYSERYPTRLMAIHQASELSTAYRRGVLDERARVRAKRKRAAKRGRRG